LGDLFGKRAEWTLATSTFFNVLRQRSNLTQDVSRIAEPFVTVTDQKGQPDQKRVTFGKDVKSIVKLTQQCFTTTDIF
jgi:hypothetical protein